MRKNGQIVLTAGLLMLVAGLVLPFVAGRAIPTTVYNVLAVGGIVVALVGNRIRARGARAESNA